MGRGLGAGERALALGVFGDALALDRVRLHGGGFGLFAFTLGSHVFLPPQLASEDFAAAPVPRQALLIHELTHVWQFQTRPAWTLASWAAQVLRGGYGPGLPAYRYALPLDFGRMNLEQQASAVEHAFLLRQGFTSAAMPPGARLADYDTLPFRAAPRRTLSASPSAPRPWGPNGG